MNKEEFVGNLNKSTPALLQNILALKITMAVKEKNVERAMNFLNIFNDCFPDEMPNEKIIEDIIHISPWIFFSRSPGNQLEIGKTVFLKNICQYMGEQYCKYKEILEITDTKKAVADILKDLGKTISDSPQANSPVPTGLAFSSNEYQADSLQAMIISGFLLVSTALSIKQYPKTSGEFIEALNQSFKELDKEKWGSLNLRQAKALIEKFTQEISE